MTTLESTATLPAVKTAPPADGKDLISLTSGVAAPRHGKDLVIHIDVGPDTASIHCLDTEHVGTHKQRCVFFSANKHCWVIFNTKTVFAVDYLELQEGESARAEVSDNTKQAQTRFAIRVSTIANVTQTGKAVPLGRNGPVIVVP